MSAGAMIWFVIFLIAAVTFFGVAAFAAIHGFRDLKELLAGTTREKKISEQ